MNNEQKTGPIRIFVDAHVFDGKYQGTRTYLKELYNILAHQPNLELYLGAQDTENLRQNFPALPNVHFVALRSRQSWYRLLVEIPRLIRRHGIHYAHFQYIVPFRKNCRYIVTIHDMVFNEYPDEFSRTYRFSRNLLFRLAAMRSELVTTVSTYSRRSIARYLKMPEEKIAIVPNGVHERFFAPYDKQAAAAHIQDRFGVGPFILYVSRIEPRKNHLALLEAYLDLKLYQRGIYLVLLGYKSIPVPAMEKRLTGLPPEVRSFIFISGEVGNDDLLSFYQACRLFVYPSRAEGFGIPPLEAAALQVPVICANTTGMAEYDFFGEDHIDPLDGEALRARIQHHIDFPQLQGNLQAIAGLVAARYSWRSAADKLYQLIRSAARG